MKKTAIITGITGQDGAYLSKLLLDKGYRVIGLLRPDAAESLDNLDYLGVTSHLSLVQCSLLDSVSIMRIVGQYRPDEIYNLAAMSSVGLSFEQPIATISFNTMSVLNLLEAVRACSPEARFYQASSSEMYGRVQELPITEKSVLHPVSPYAISKASSHWTVVNYREAYGLFCCCGILFNHESYLRAPNFFTKKLFSEAIRMKQGKQRELRVGNIEVRRDMGYAPRYVEAMHLMLQQPSPDDFLICSGKSILLRDIVEHVFARLGIRMDRLVVDPELYRPADIENIYGDNRKARAALGWEYDLDFLTVTDMLLDEEEKNRI